MQQEGSLPFTRGGGGVSGDKGCMGSAQAAERRGSPCPLISAAYHDVPPSCPPHQVTRALEVLRSPAVSPELAYKFAPALAALAPEESVRAWVAANPPLDPERLLPALLALSSGARADATSRAAALSFVRAALDAGAGVQALHDLALDLYSALDGG